MTARAIASAVAALAGESVAIQQELIAVRNADEIVRVRDHPFNGDPGSLQIAELSLERLTQRHQPSQHFAERKDI